MDRGHLETTAASLRNPNALLSDLQEVLMSVYQEMLRQAKIKKKQLAAIKVHVRDCTTYHRISMLHEIIKLNSKSVLNSAVQALQISVCFSLELTRTKIFMKSF